MSEERKGSLWTSAIFGALFLAVLGIALVARSGARASEERGSENALPVAVVEVVLSDRFEVQERLAGRVVSRRRSELGFERHGRLVEIAVDEGERVEAGALLARLDTRELVAEQRELAARLESTRARLELARVTAARQRKLSQSDYLSAQALDEALANESALEAQLAADRAALERTGVAIELSSLRAPYPAVVVSRLVDEGSIAAPGQPVLSILEDGVQEVQLGVPPELASALEIGRRHSVESGDVSVPATLRRIVPELDARTRTQTAILEIATDDAGGARLADGSLAWVRLGREVEARGGWLPLGALAEGRRGTWTAFAVVPDAEGHARIERRQVEIIQTEATRAFVRGTLRDGDRIVRDGLHRLVPGLRVEVIDAPRADPSEPDAPRVDTGESDASRALEDASA